MELSLNGPNPWKLYAEIGTSRGEEKSPKYIYLIMMFNPLRVRERIPVVCNFVAWLRGFMTINFFTHIFQNYVTIWSMIQG